MVLQLHNGVKVTDIHCVCLLYRVDDSIVSDYVKVTDICLFTVSNRCGEEVVLTYLERKE
jgi:hypothetical protein